MRDDWRAGREAVGWSQITTAALLGERDCACGDERVVLFRDGERTRTAKIVSVEAVEGVGEREVVIDAETKTFSEEAKAVLRFGGMNLASAARVFSGQAAICIQACADRSGLF